MADNGIVQRVIALARYAISGNAPADWFGPAQPMVPMAPEEVKGRQYDYPVAINLNYMPRAGEPVGFAKLKALAHNSDILRIVMDGQKDKLEAQEWTIKPRDQGGKKGEADQSVRDIEALLQYPDRNLDWPQWLRALIDQLFVLDAVSIYRRRDLGGRPYSFELLDGAMIKVLLDQSGRRPMTPDPAYQQIIKGVVAANFTTDDLLYYPQNVRADHAYGLSRVEQIITVVETQIQRLKHQKAFFTHGNLSDGFFSAPQGTTPDQVRQVEQMWNALLAQGDVESRRVNQFLPAGYQWNPIGAPPLQDEFDQWLARIICFTFSTSPTPFLKQTGMGHGSAETQHEAAESAGLANLMSYIRRIMNRLLIEDFKRPDLEFSWVEDREFDPQVKAEIEDARLRNGSLTLDEVRDRNGEDALPNGAGAKAIIYTASGPILLDDVINPPEPVVPAIDPNTPPLAANDPANKEPKPALAKAASKASAEKAIAKAVAAFLAEKGAEIGAALGEALGLAKAAPADDAGSDGFGSRIDAALDDIDWNWTELAAEVQPALTGIAVAAGKSAVSELGLFDKAVLAKMTVDATTYAESRAAEMVGMKLVDGQLVENEGWSIPAATRDMVRSAVTQAMEEGQSNQELATAIRESGAFSKERATVIARTETAKADVQGSIAGWKASGLVAGKQFDAAPDCCDECQEVDGEIVSLDEEFSQGDPPLHPQCRCSASPILTDEMPDTSDDGE